VNRDFLFGLVYFATLLVHLYAGNAGQDVLTQLTKPALVSSLIIYVLLSARKRSFGKFGTLLILGLVFSLGGDVLLMFQEVDDVWFTLGLGSFLIAHVLYTIAFTKTYLDNHTIPLLKRYGWVLIAVVGYGLYFFNLIKDHLGSMLGPVMVYTLAITVMLLLALNRYEKVSTRSFMAIAVGALFFVASDSILAWNKFVHPLDYSHVLIMGTYGIAQYGIALGGVFQLRHRGVVTLNQNY
jgi:uncharacterized membrane protein YhhN